MSNCKELMAVRLDVDVIQRLRDIKEETGTTISGQITTALRAAWASVDKRPRRSEPRRRARR